MTSEIKTYNVISIIWKENSFENTPKISQIKIETDDSTFLPYLTRDG